MFKKETRVQKIVKLTAAHFRSFGGGKVNSYNPISAALKDRPPQFAAGVDVEQVVRFVLNKNKSLKRKRKAIGDDARDHANTASYLRPLSDHQLRRILILGHDEVRTRLKFKKYPFYRLGPSSRDILLGLPLSWIKGAAELLISFRNNDIN